MSSSDFHWNAFSCPQLTIDQHGSDHRTDNKTSSEPPTDSSADAYASADESVGSPDDAPI